LPSVQPESSTAAKLSPSFARLNATQFLGAMNDNILKLLIIFCLIGARGADRAGVITAGVGAAFVLPFLLFSAPAGCLADRLAKSRIIVAVKLMEVAVTALAVVAFALEWHDGLYPVIFLMAAHSALFAPAKYGVIPELAGREQLSRANGLVESFTYLAIIFGTTMASLLAQVVGRHFWLAALFCLLVAVSGFWAASGMETTPVADSRRRISPFPDEILRTLLGIRHDRDLMLAVIGQAYFLFVGAFAQLNLIAFGMQGLGLTEAQSGYLFLAAALGIGGGSLLAARISGREVELGIVPIGAIGLTFAPVMLHAVPPSLPSSLLLLALFGISAGLFSLPLQTFIQFRAEPARLGEVLAASSFINWVGILLASVTTWFFSGPLRLSAAQGFSLVGVLTMVLTLIAFWTLPGFLSRFVALIATRLFCRVVMHGGEHLPAGCPALLVSRDAAPMDAMLLAVATRRRVGFVTNREIRLLSVQGVLCRLAGCIPLFSGNGGEKPSELSRKGRAAPEDAHMLFVVGEGQQVHDGVPFDSRSGFDLLMREEGWPLIPFCVMGAMDHASGGPSRRTLRRRINILFGPPMPAVSTALEVRRAIVRLSADRLESRKPA